MKGSPPAMTGDYRKMYPIMLALEGMKCLVVGGGRVARRKVAALANAGADVTVVALDVLPEIEEHARDKSVIIEKREYKEGEAADYFIVVAATSNRELNRRVSEDARAAGRPVNAVDMPELCTFYVPSILRRGELLVALSTSGACPALARKMRRDLEAQFPDSYAHLLDALRAFRAEVIEKIDTEPERKKTLEKVVYSDELEAFLEGDEEPLRLLMKQCVS